MKLELLMENIAQEPELVITDKNGIILVDSKTNTYVEDETTGLAMNNSDVTEYTIKLDAEGFATVFLTLDYPNDN